MQRYLVHRLLAAIPVILLVGIITFSLLHIAPGDPASVMAGPMASPELVEKIRHRLGTDKPFPHSVRLLDRPHGQGAISAPQFSRDGRLRS